MPTLDLAMPITLLVVVVVAMLLNKRSEGKLQSTIEQKEFKTRDVVLLIVFMAIIVSGLAYAAMINPGAIFEDCSSRVLYFLIHNAAFHDFIYLL